MKLRLNQQRPHARVRTSSAWKGDTLSQDSIFHSMHLNSAGSQRTSTLGLCACQEPRVQTVQAGFSGVVESQIHSGEAAHLVCT